MTEPAPVKPFAMIRQRLLVLTWVAWGMAVVILIVYAFGGFDFLGLFMPAVLIVVGFNLLMWRWLLPAADRQPTPARRIGFTVGFAALAAGISVLAVILLILLAFFIIAWTS
jgi:hypothetical protein